MTYINPHHVIDSLAHSLPPLLLDCLLLSRLMMRSASDCAATCKDSCLTPPFLNIQVQGTIQSSTLCGGGVEQSQTMRQNFNDYLFLIYAATARDQTDQSQSQLSTACCLELYHFLFQLKQWRASSYRLLMMCYVLRCVITINNQPVAIAIYLKIDCL